jgi:predicted nucleotidyltransferase component of viral defense system
LTKPAPKNLPASVRQKLANLARERNVDFGLILVKYGLERILFRLSRSRHRDDFVLKGALLFELWTEQRNRPTRDADFLARGDNAPGRFAHIFRELCVLEVDDDGLRFDAETVEAERISEDADYEGVRVTLLAYLERAKIPIQIDIGFGDIVTPAPSQIGYPTLMEFPGPRLLAYPKETVVAEKLEALVKLGIANTRMKDFYDLVILSRTFEFEGKFSPRRFKTPFKNDGLTFPWQVCPSLSRPSFMTT